MQKVRLNISYQNIRAYVLIPYNCIPVVHNIRVSFIQLFNYLMLMEVPSYATWQIFLCLSRRIGYSLTIV